MKFENKCDTEMQFEVNQGKKEGENQSKKHRIKVKSTDNKCVFLNIVTLTCKILYKIK